MSKNFTRAVVTLLALAVIGTTSHAATGGKSAPAPASQRRARTAARPSALSSSSLQGLLDSSGLDYTTTKEGTFKVIVSVEGETTLIYAREATIGSGADPDFKLVQLYLPLVIVPNGFRHPPAMLKKIAEINDRILVGRISVDGQKGNVWYNSSFWLSNANSNVLLKELYLAHYLRPSLRKDLLPFVQE